MSHTLTQGLAEQFVRIALRNIKREYPNNLDHALVRAADARTPRDLHPIFYGSYDWHSCVHNHWLLAYLLRRFPDFVPSADIRILFDSQFVPDKVAGECSYFNTPTARKFKRPYGWAWLLKLAAELSGHDDNPWSRNLAPLTDTIVQLLRDFLPLATYPIRVGTHFNTAFALRMAADYADAVQDLGLATLLLDTSRRWYGADTDCPAWGEPSLDDFQSSALIEAECMRRLLPAGKFLPWLDRFLPHIAERKPETLFRPASVSDRTDGKIAHLDGLNLSRAWCWRSIALELSLSDPRRSIAEKTADHHLMEALPHIAGDYAGEHWLATFAVLALDVRV